MDATIITQIINKVPEVIAALRTLIIKAFETVHLPENSYLIFFIAIALFLGYKWIKQWITYSIWTKLSTIINWILLSLVLFLLFTRVQ